VFIASFFTSQKVEAAQGPSVGKWINKMGYREKDYSVLERKEILTQATK
jgi:hypothetical protein